MSQTHPEIPAEQRFVDHASDCLHEAQQRSGRLAESGADKNAARALKRLGDDLRKRQLEAEDRICFARLDCKDHDHPVYIGREPIYDGGKVLVSSWAAKAAAPYFEAGPGKSMGLLRRRKFDLDGTTVLGITDEEFAALPDRLKSKPTGAPAKPARPRDERVAETPQLAFADDLLRELARSRAAEMRDIVPTIQRDQFALISAPPEGVLIVQGGPGTGKTAVALQRAAWLAFNFQKDLGHRTGILVVGPNRAFMDYISGVLPGLGATDVAQAPVDALVVARDPHGRQVRAERAEASPELARLKGDPRMAVVLEQCARSRVRPPEEPVNVTIGRTRLTFEPSEIKRIIRSSWGTSGSQRAYMRAREQFIASMRAHATNLYGDAHRGRSRELDASALARVLNARSGPWFNLLTRLWPSMSAPQLVHELYTIDQRMEDAANGVLDQREQELLMRKDVKNVREQVWTNADVPVVDEADQIVHGQRDGTRFGYVIVDETQNLTPMQLRMVRRRCATGNLMLVGDLAQARGPWSYSTWESVAGHLPATRAPRVEHMTRGYRVPAPIVALASTLLPRIADGLPAVQAIRPGLDPSIEYVDAADLADLVAVEAANLRERDRTVGVIVPAALLQQTRAALADAGIQAGDVEKDALERQVTLLPPGAASGLEFDNAIVVEPARIVAESERGYAELYIALTRPTQRLSIVHALPLPAPLPGGTEPADADAATEPPTAAPPAAPRRATAVSATTAQVLELGGRFSEALVYSKLLHGEQPRRGTAVPFLSHLLAVCALVLNDGGTEDEAIAALLHDAAEQHHSTATVHEIADRFGPDIAAIVALCSEPASNGSSWRARKREHLETLEAAPVAVRRVALAEKLDNARTIVRQLREFGPDVWTNMAVDAADVLWYFDELARLFADVHPGAMAAELQEQAGEMHTLAGA